MPDVCALGLLQDDPSDCVSRYFALGQRVAQRASSSPAKRSEAQCVVMLVGESGMGSSVPSAARDRYRGASFTLVRRLD